MKLVTIPKNVLFIVFLFFKFLIFRPFLFAEKYSYFTSEIRRVRWEVFQTVLNPFDDVIIGE